MNKKKDIYVEFDNGKKLRPKDIVNIMVRLRATGSIEDIVRVISLEYKFTVNDFMKFRTILESLVYFWDDLEGMKKMIVAFVAFAAVAALLIVSLISITKHVMPLDMNHLKMDITFFAISLLSTIVMTHIIIKNRAEIKGLIFEDD